MSLHIAVFLKQVADNTKLKFNETGPVLENVPMMLNPYDEYALETAIRLKESAGADASLSVITMGTLSAKEILKKAVAVGADSAFLITNDALAQSDSTANAKILAQALRSVVPNFNLLVFGQTALDSLDGQTGQKVAELLNLPSLTFCKGAEFSNGSITATRETERGYEVHEMSLPGALCMMKCDYELRGSNIKGVMKANKTEIPVTSLAELGITQDQSGEAMSATKTLKTWQRPPRAEAKIIDGANPQEAVASLIGALKEAKVF
ncbi:MAG: electron transfer flavoprotein subunit beta/FixA family protein [Vampirovibrionales bacterium]|nr:electron transfer flavoprotein subunit beta/FixA family protein [Vampirovibrionales bacterium]